MLTYHSRGDLPHFEVPGGNCHLTWRLKAGQAPLGPDERSIVLELLRRDHDSRCQILAAVVMDDHVHVLAGGFRGVTSMQLARAWKTIGSHYICRSGARRAPLWRRDSYQRWIRHPGHLDICAQYIRQNPQRKWPGVGEYEWVL